MAQTSRFTLPLVGLVIVFVVVIAVTQWQSEPRVPLPRPLPQTEVQGWLNVEEPLQSADLAGKWVVMDLWATWCQPCLNAMPEVAEFRERWRERDVEVVGISEDGRDKMIQLNQILETIPAMEWPIAYGGREVFRAVEVQGIPLLVLYDPSGTEVWRGHTVSELEAELAERMEE